jgi:chromosome segregation ATPase
VADDVPELRRSLFGYNPEKVRQLLADREAMFRLAQGREQQAQTRVTELQGELDAIGAELEVTTRDLDLMRSELTELETRADTADALRLAAESQLETSRQLERERAESLDDAERRIEALERDLGMSRREVGAVQTELEVARAELSSSEDRARSAAALVTDLEGELLDTRSRAASADARLAEMRDELEAARVELARTAEGERAQPLLATEELSVILDTAERGVLGVMERTKAAYQAQLTEIERQRRTIQEEIDRFADWRAHVVPRTQAIQESITDARERIALVPQQINEAVGSMVEAIGTLSESLDRLSTIPSPLTSDGSMVERSDPAGGGVIRLSHSAPDGADADPREDVHGYPEEPPQGEEAGSPRIGPRRSFN